MVAELAGFIILLVVVAVGVLLYCAARWLYGMWASRKRWRVEIRGDGAACRVQVEQGAYHRVTVASLSTSDADFEKQLDEAIQRADALAASMNANRSIR